MHSASILITIQLTNKKPMQKQIQNKSNHNPRSIPTQLYIVKIIRANNYALNANYPSHYNIITL